MILLRKLIISLWNAVWQFVSHLLRWSHYESWWSRYETQCGNLFHICCDDLTMKVDDLTMTRDVAIRFTFIEMISLRKLIISLWNAVWQFVSHLLRWSHYESWWSHYETKCGNLFHIYPYDLTMNLHDLTISLAVPFRYPFFNINQLCKYIYSL